MRSFLATLALAGALLAVCAPAMARPHAVVAEFAGDRYAARTAMMSARDVVTDYGRRHRAGVRRHKPKHPRRVIHARQRQIAPASPTTLLEGFRREVGTAVVTVFGGRPAGAPRAWCGWYLGRLLGLHDRRLWLARNWANVGSNAGGPQVGAVVVWRHHVGIITGRQAGKWVVKSGNDGRRVRERPRSLAGAIAFRVI